MEHKQLQIIDRPVLHNTRMVLSFSGWMDGGEVSTGTVEYLVEEFGARKLAQIDPDEFYIYNFPGSMEFSALFRPYIHLEEGLILNYQDPSNEFFYDATNRLILFTGKEPNLRWKQFARCVFKLADEFNVTEIYFIGSVGGLVPHTREPRIMCTVSDEKLKSQLEELNFKLSNYKGPGSITNHLLECAEEKNIDMVSIVAEIPAYVQGRNPKCIEAIIKRLAKLLNLDINLDELRLVSDVLEKKIDKLIQDRPELTEHIKKLEENYDKELFDTGMADLKQWLEQQGIRLD